MKDYGPQYSGDDEFKAKARLHQSRFRVEVLQAGYREYGNRLEEKSARNLLNYYEKFNIRDLVKRRYPGFSQKRDGDMLRSEHIPFNMFGPLAQNHNLAKRQIEKAFGIQCRSVKKVEIEYAPSPKKKFLNDATSFDAYIEAVDPFNRTIGIGVEVKYTELSYVIGKNEAKQVQDKSSPYWETTRASGEFIDPGDETLGDDLLRQVWRNHLLGLSMVQNRLVDQFYSVTVFPAGNQHFIHAIGEYRKKLNEKGAAAVSGCTYERFISAIEGDAEMETWKKYLEDRYLF